MPDISVQRAPFDMTVRLPAMASAMPRPIFQFSRSPNHKAAMSVVSTGLHATISAARPAAAALQP